MIPKKCYNHWFGDGLLHPWFPKGWFLFFDFSIYLCDDVTKRSRNNKVKIQTCPQVKSLGKDQFILFALGCCKSVRFQRLLSEQHVLLFHVFSCSFENVFYLWLLCEKHKWRAKPSSGRTQTMKHICKDQFPHTYAGCCKSVRFKSCFRCFSFLPHTTCSANFHTDAGNW